MKLKLISSTLALTLLGAAFAVNDVACGSAATTESSGTLSAAVTTVGPDGATYALPTGATLSLVSSTSSATYSIAVDGNEATESYTLPAGTYSATLSSVTSLVRTASSGPATSVPATLSDAQPYQVVVTAGATTSLTFHFAIAGTGENLTFSTGTVSTNVVVSATGGSSTGVGATFQVTLAAGGSSTTINGYATGAMQGTLTVTTTGAFAPAVDEVCAPIGALVLSGVVDNGYGYNVLEGAGSTGDICFSNRVPGDTGNDVLPAGWDGVTTWQGNVAILLSNGASTSDQYLLTGYTTTPAFNGTTLNLSALATATSFTATSFLYWESEGTASVTSPATIELLP
ncbi:MAG: hypothetical protein ACLQVI_35805 [Polyangiaceae bacterium]|jgi:hypothetical protein